MKIMFQNNSGEWQEIPVITAAEIESTEPDDAYPRINDMSTEITLEVDPCGIRAFKKLNCNNWRRRHGMKMIRYKEILRAGRRG